MASRKRYNVSQALELVMQEGSDIEEEDFESEGSSTLVEYSEEEFVPMSDELTDESDVEETEVVAATVADSSGSDHGSDEEMDAGDGGGFYNDEDDEEWMSEWTKDLSNFPMNAPFTGSPGLNLPDDFPATPTPLDFYRLFISRNLLKSFKVETNRYATAVCAQKKAAGGLSKRSIYVTWKPVTIDDMSRFIAILLHMGLVKKPQFDDYWSTHPSLSTTFASRLMKRSRFKAILAFFHLNDNAKFIPRGQADHDPLHKLRPLFDHLAKRFHEVYTPEEAICIDEAMCPWRGRSAFRVYMRDKPTKWGIKLYELCESNSGFVCNLEVMCHQPGVSNAPFDVCMRLLQRYINKGHTLYVDNYYCNPHLADTLAAENTSVVGTVRPNRIGLPKDLATQKMVQGEMDYRRKNQVLYVHWKDKRDVHVLSTKHLPEMVDVRSRAEHKMKPVCVVDYSANMAGVDKSDQMISYLPLHRKTVKWWKKLCFHLITLSMIQAHILYNKWMRRAGKKELSLEEFVKDVCINFGSLPADEPSTSGAATPPADIMNRLRPGNHFPVDIPAKPGAKRKPQRGCKVCYARMKHQGASEKDLKNRVKVTSYLCEQCQVPLCVTPCFKIFHSVDKYNKWMPQ